MAGSDGFKPEKEALLSNVDNLKDELSSRQENESTANLLKLRRTYGANVCLLKEKPEKSEKREDGLHAWVDLQSNSRKKEIETLQKANGVLRTDIVTLTTRAD